MIVESQAADPAEHRMASRIAHRITDLVGPFINIIAHQQLLSECYKICREEIERERR